MGKGLSISGFVLSLVGLVLSFLSGVFSIISLPTSIVGLVLSVIGGKKLKNNGMQGGMATAGLVIGIIAVVLSSILFFTCGLCTLAVLGSM